MKHTPRWFTSVIILGAIGLVCRDAIAIALR